MAQAQSPIFPEGTTLITPELAFERRGDQVVYFNGQLPVFTHEQDDLATFRMFTTQRIVNGTASQVQIAKTFGLSLTAIKRCVKKFRERGSKAFYHAPAKRQGRKLNPEGLEASARVAGPRAESGCHQPRKWVCWPAHCIKPLIVAGCRHQKKDAAQVEICVRCLRCWVSGCCGTPDQPSLCPMGFIGSRRSFECWPF